MAKVQAKFPEGRNVLGEIKELLKQTYTFPHLPPSSPTSNCSTCHPGREAPHSMRASQAGGS